MACWCYCCVRQSLSVSGITQLDSSHCQGHVGLPGHNQNSRADSLTTGQETNLCVCWQRLQSSASTMTYLPNKQIFFLWGWQIRSATEVRRNVQATCFPERSSAPVNPGSVSNICAHLALFLSPLQWIFLKADWFEAEKRIPLASE